jgi:hypothetical protein
MNSYFQNELGIRRFFVYTGCKTVDEAFRLTALKKGGDYIEDDSKYYQHISTSISYSVFYQSSAAKIKKTIQQRIR